MRLALGSGSASQGEEVTIPLTMSADSPVQGLAAIFQWDGRFLEGMDLSAGAALASADTVIQRVEPSFMVLGVIVDIDGDGENAIPAGENLDLASAAFRCLPGDSSKKVIDLEFVDGTHAAVNGGTALDNIITVKGRSVGVDQGLELVAGQVTCLPAADTEFVIESSGNDAGSRCGSVNVVMNNPVTEVEGYVIAIAHPPALSVQDISIIGTAAEEFGADFAEIDLLANGGTVGVILDLVPPFQGNVIPAGQGHVIARYTYCCEELPVQPDPPSVHALTFVNDQLGDPPKSNIIVAGGISIPAALRDGTFTCAPVSEICDDEVDNDNDGQIDCDDLDCADNVVCVGVQQAFAVGSRKLASDGIPEPVAGSLGLPARVYLFYKSPEDFVPGGPQFDRVQGLSMALSYPCELQCDESSLDTSDTIVSAINADFVSLQCDNDPNDGDDCEMVFALLVDALPPFDGATLPPIDFFLPLASFEVAVPDDTALCDVCLPLEFRDGLNGRGNVPIRNLVSVENTSRRPQLVNNEICITSRPVFLRGDCDSSGSLNISDAARIVLFIFSSLKNPNEPPCLDACDCNDDGLVDFADAVCILRYLVQDGDPPPAPGPGLDMFGFPTPPGEDPTPDDLICGVASSCPP